jgi:hypothetical protein
VVISASLHICGEACKRYSVKYDGGNPMVLVELGRFGCMATEAVSVATDKPIFGDIM